jgi:pentatricopeptide repeat protein
MDSTDKVIAILCVVVFGSIAAVGMFGEYSKTKRYTACMEVQKEMSKAGITPKDKCE